MDMPLALLNRRRRGGASFEKTLFNVPGSRGFFYDFSDYSTMFQDTAGTTAITGVGQSLGLVLDKSAGLALGPELVTNGDFSAGSTGWTFSATAPATVSFSGGVFTFSSPAGEAAFAQQTVLTIGRSYRVTIVVTAVTGAGLRVQAGSGALGAGQFTITSPGTYSPLLLCNGTDGNLLITRAGAGSGTVDSISARESQGNHATQATAGSRALTQVRPMFTQRNRAVGSELPENVTYWPASISSNGITATKVASGVDTDGLPYVDYSVVGTASATSLPLVYGTASRTPATLGQQYFASFRAQIISGTVPPANCGIRAEVAEETAPSTFLTASVGTVFASTTEGTVFATATLAFAGVNQASGRVVIRTESGSTVNYTIRIKGLMFELGSARTTYQPAVSGELRNLLTWTEGTVAQLDNASNVTNATTTISGYQNSIQLGDNSVTRFAYKAFTMPAGAAYTVSFYVQMDDNSAPVVGLASNLGDFSITVDSNAVSSGADVTVTLVSGSLYRVTGRVASSTAGSRNNGVVKFNTQSAKGFRVTGYQLEVGSTATAYQRVVTANEWYEPGFTSYRGIRFDGSDDFLQTAAIDFAGAEVLGSELVSNGTFGTGDLTGWTTAHTAPSTVSVVAGVATWSTDGVNAARIRQSFTTVVGRTYTVSCAGAGVSVSIGTTAGGAEIVALATNNSRPAFTFVATSTTTWLNTTTATNGATLDNVSVKEVLIPADKMTVVAGVRKLSDAARAVLVELGTGAANSFRIEAPGSSLNNYAMASGGSTIVGTTAAGFSSPISSVLSGLGDISGDNVALRHNGTQVASSPSDQGTGNFANDIVYIGRRGGTTLPFNGIITFLCVINRTLTASELAQLETFANSRTGAY